MKILKKLLNKLDLDAYFISNTISYIAIYALSLKVCFLFVDNIIIRIIFSVLSLLLCGYLQQWVISRLINTIISKIEKLLKK